MGDVREDVGGCNILNDESIKVITPLSLYVYIINTPKELFIYT